MIWRGSTRIGSEGRPILSPADYSEPSETVRVGRGLIVFILIAIAFSGSFGDIRIASFSLTAIAATLTGALCWTLVLLYRHVPAAATRVALAFAAFGFAMLMSMLVGSTTRQGIQFVVVLAAFLGALLLAATVRRAIGGSLESLVGRCFRITASLLVAAAVLGQVGVANAVDVRPTAIVALIGMGWFLAEHRLGRRHSLWWALASLGGIGVSLSRGALLAGFVLVLVAMCLGASKGHRARRIVLALLVLAGGYSAITYWAPLRDRFVQGDVSLSVAGFNVNGEGRAQVWSALWAEWPNQPIVGHGPGEASDRSLQVNPAFDHPHNDYLLLFYDFGLVGVILFAWFLFRSWRQLSSIHQRAPSALAPVAALYAGFAVLIVMATDNPLDYPFVMIPLGVLMGLGLGALIRSPKAVGARALLHG